MDGQLLQFPPVSRVLKSKDFDVVGTIRQNRRFVPYEIAKLKQNTLATNEAVSCISGDVDIIAWRDNRLVCLTSTYHGNAVSEDNGKRSLTLLYRQQKDVNLLRKSLVPLSLTLTRFLD